MDDENPLRARDREDGKTRPTCQTCPYWHLMNWSDPDFIWGLCVIRHPSVNLTKEEDFTERPDSLWPGTIDADFCGEHPDFPAWIASRSKPTTSNPKPDSPMLSELTRNDIVKLSLRAHRALFRLPLDTRITEITEASLLELNGVGMMTYFEIREWIRETYGFTALT